MNVSSSPSILTEKVRNDLINKKLTKEEYRIYKDKWGCMTRIPNTLEKKRMFVINAQELDKKINYIDREVVT